MKRKFIFLSLLISGLALAQQPASTLGSGLNVPSGVGNGVGSPSATPFGGSPAPTPLLNESTIESGTEETSPGEVQQEEDLTGTGTNAYGGAMGGATGTGVSGGLPSGTGIGTPGGSGTNLGDGVGTPGAGEAAPGIGDPTGPLP